MERTKILRKILLFFIVRLISLPTSVSAFSVEAGSSSFKKSVTRNKNIPLNGTNASPQAKTAIILNTNARSVAPYLGDVAKSVFGADAVFVTSSEQQAQDAAAAIIENGYSLAVPVGGDGTVSSIINYMVSAVMVKNPEIRTLEQAVGALPVLGYIPLGTGNGVGSVVGCRIKGGGFLPGARRRKKKHFRRMIERLKEVGEYLSNNKDPATRTNFDVIDMPMMQVTHNDDSSRQRGDMCFFAGVGFDSLMLDDFKQIKAWSIQTNFLRRILSSVTGYCVALVVKTLPKTVFQGKHNIQVKVKTNDPDTLWVDHRRGDVVQKCPDPLLYEGQTGILAAGTSPFYGGGLRLFPFARMTTDKMHLRLGRIHPLTGFWNIPSIFEGSYRDKSDRFGCIDFIGGDFEVEVTSPDEEEKGFPLQHSGESVGHVERFRLRVVDEPVRFVSFLKKR